MSDPVPWDPDFAVGHAVIDAQHRELLDQCQRLGEAGFAQAFDQFKALARRHFETEAALLADADAFDPEDLLSEREEFEFLVGEIATRENFDALEIRQFLSRWWLGHIAGSAESLRAWTAEGKTSA
jgi:hemerythrin